MRKLLLLVACLVWAFAIQAAEEKKQTARQDRMTACARGALASYLKGADRKAFLSKCLSAGG